MEDKLRDMTLEELWELFPVVLVEHEPEWSVWADEEIGGLSRLLSDFSPVISHIGSTAVRGIWAKPIIDILVEVTPNRDLHEFKSTLEQVGYLCMCESEYRLSFNKGYTEEGFAERVYHLHLCKSGDHDELYFRDYLNRYPAAAKEYEDLKLDLWRQYEHDRDAYTEGKTAFVETYTQKAKQRFKNRYEIDKEQT